jgi:LAS superfamily LD-carboxypeptidase LdcB
MAQSELGFAGSADHRAFAAALAAEPGWDARLARRLLDITANFKAPRGGSTHHSGLVVDINFPYATDDGSVHWHDIKRENNADALRSAAGVWLSAHAPAHGFDSYDTASEIWHQEWRDWAGTPADPDYVPPTP